MKFCTFPLHKKGGHVMNECLAKITTVAGPEGGHATINQKALNGFDVELLAMKTAQVQCSM